MTISELLDELKQVDPITYKEISISFAWAEIQWAELYPEYEDDRPHLPVNIAINEYESDLIQGCIQRACERRGWEIEQNYRTRGRDGDLPKNMRHYAVVTSWDNDVHTYRGMGNSATKALLAAYIAAVKEEAKR